MMSDNRELTLLRDLIRREGLRHYEKPVKLSSGAHTTKYYDLKTMLSNGSNLRLASRVLSSFICSTKANIESVGGIETGSIPLAAMIAADSNISYFYIRKKRKLHGLEKLIEGSLIPPAVLVDDVVTTGETMIRAGEIMKDLGVNSFLSCALVFRGPKEKIPDISALMGNPFQPLFNDSDFCV